LERGSAYKFNQEPNTTLATAAAVAPDEPAFTRVLDRFYRGEPDAATIALLGDDAAFASPETRHR